MQDLEVYKKLPGSADACGVFYEHYISLLLYTRATKNAWKFRMAQNMKAAHGFDDVVISFPDKTFFIQLKHKTGSQTVSASNLQNLGGMFSLFKYFRSYCLLKEGYSKDLSCLGKFEDFVFVIYTNASLNEQIRTCIAPLEEKWINFLHTGGEAYCFSASHFENVTEFLDKREAYMSLLKKANESVSLLSSEEKHSLLTFIQLFCNNDIDTLPNSEGLQKELKRVTALFQTNENGKVKQVADMTSTCFESFLKQLVFFSNQSSEGVTEKIILKELEQIYMKKISDVSHIDKMRKKFQKLADRDCYITPESNFWVDEVVNPWILELSKEMLEELKPLLKITFSDEEYKQILVHRVQLTVADKGGAKITLLKIHQCLKSEPHIMMTWKKFCEHNQEVLSLWEKWCDVLVLEMDSNVNINSMIQQVKKLLENERKRLVFVTEQHTKSKFLNYVRTIVDIGSVWSSLSKESKEDLLDVKVMVQGTEISFGQAVGEEIHKWEQLVNSGFLLHLMKARDPVRFGSKIKAPDMYIQRPLQRFETLNDSVIHIPKAKFAVSGITEMEFVRRFSVGIMLNRFTMISTSEEFKSLARKFKNQNLHWLHYNGNDLVWKQSVGEMSDLMEHVEVHSGTPRTWDSQEILNKPRMLLTAESGLGKSTFLSQMAAEIKLLKGGTIWIAKINLENHQHAFDCRTNLPKMVDLMLATQKRYNSKVDTAFLEMMLKAGRVTVFFDSFDEVSHSDNVLVALRNFLKRYPDITLWIASRPVTGGRLETLLQMLPYSLPYFKCADQEKYLLHKWRQKDLDISLVKKFIEYILKKVYMYPRGVPLLLLIISETFQEDLMLFVKNGIMFSSAEGVDNVFLHEKYIRKKLEIYCERNGVNVNTKPIIEAFYMENHMLLSLAEIIDINKLDISSYLKIKVSSVDMKKIQSMGIIHKSSSGRSSFLHRSFAEYFIALWFKMYHPSSINYLRDQIFKREFQPIRKFLDCLLAKELTLHSEIIKGKKDIDLLTSEETINSKDIAGRTPLHVLVLVYKDEKSFGNTYSSNDSLFLAVQLLNAGANPNITDRMLGWNCAQYALQAETWALLELMLKYKVNYNCLNSITEKLNKAPSKDTLLGEIAEYGFTNMLRLILKHTNINEYVKHRRVQKTMLHIAVEVENLELVKKLVNSGADVNMQMKKRNFKNGTALHIAAQKGSLSIAKLLLDNHALLNATGAFSRVPIEEAAAFSKWRMVRFLSDQGDRMVYTPLVCAVKRGKLSVVKHIIGNHDITLHQKNNLMNLAIVVGKLDIVKYLVSQGLTLNKFHTSLMKAAKFGMLGIVKYLIENGAAVNGTTKFGHTPLYEALVSGKRKTANFLRKAGGTFSSRELEIKAFHEAVRLGNMKTLNIFLENIQVDERNTAGWTALHVAAWVGNDAIIKFLLSRGANINAVTEKSSGGPSFNNRAPHLVGNTALHLAAARGKEATLKLLIDRKADISRYNKDGEMALHTAACRGYYSLLYYLCTVYDVNHARTRKSDLVIHCAIRQKNLDVVRTLTEECNAEVNVQGHSGSTPLCLAVEYNSVPLVLHLLHRGADINGRDGAGNSPLILSVLNNKPDIMHILLKKGAVTNFQNKKGSTALHVAAGRMDFYSVWTLTSEGINVDMRDRKGRTAQEIAEQRYRRKPDCRAVIHIYQRQHSSNISSRGYSSSGRNTERCICVSKSAAGIAEHIANHIKQISRRKQ